LCYHCCGKFDFFCFSTCVRLVLESHCKNPFVMQIITILHHKNHNMNTIRKSITFTNQQNEWIKLQLEKGDFTNDSEYIRDLVRKDQSENLKLVELKNAIDEGFNSGVSDKTISDLMREVDNGQL